MWLVVIWLAMTTYACALTMPPMSPTGVANRLWTWRGFNVRYQALGEEQSGPALLLVHGLFVNADHWRKNLPELAAAGFRVYAIDLLGSGYSDKPYPTSLEARAISGERGRSLGAPEQPIGSSSGAELPPRVLPGIDPRTNGLSLLLTSIQRLWNRNPPPQGLCS